MGEVFKIFAAFIYSAAIIIPTYLLIKYRKNDRNTK
jgi:hypothetical protein